MITKLTLADGTEITRVTNTKRYWQSRLMDLAPYGTDFQGCTFSYSNDGTYPFKVWGA